MKINPRDLQKHFTDEYDDFGELQEVKLQAKRKIHNERTDREFSKQVISRYKAAKDQQTK
jgi:hypothetical protein